MEIENLVGKTENLNIRAFLPALTVLLAWIITGLVLTNSIDFELEYLVSVLSIAVLIPLAYFWNDMDGPAGETWRNIISAGIFINLVAVGMVFLDAYTVTLIELAILYWIAVPGYGLMVNSNFIEEYSSRYTLLSHLSSFATITYFICLFQIIDPLIMFSALATGVSHSIAAYTSLKA